MEKSMLKSISGKFDALFKGVRLIRLRLEALEEMLSEEKAGEDDRRALKEALEEHKRGETISLEEPLRKMR